MIRVNAEKRPNWEQSVESIGFKFHTFFRYDDGEIVAKDADIEGEAPQPGVNGQYETYWDESAYYRFTLDQIEKDIEDPTAELHHMCLQAVERIVHDDDLLRKIAIPEYMWDRIRESWNSNQPHLYGRMDFSYNGSGPAKLLELNYDTPTSLYEAGAVQWHWLNECMQRGMLPPQTDQYNALHEFMEAIFLNLRSKFEDETPLMHFSCARDSVEDRSTVMYMQEIAEAAGIQTRFLYVDEIGLNAEGEYVDLDEEPILAIFKLYPWEDMFTEEFGPELATASTHWFEPPWKAILSNKGILPVLWEMFPDHPNLLPAYFADADATVAPGWVKKPLFSREGSNVTICTPDGRIIKEDGPYSDIPCIIQAYHPLPVFGDYHTVIGSWVVGDRAVGIGIREDGSPITKDTSRFVPHVIL
jgi:glutathionylspermidine synthase